MSEDLIFKGQFKLIEIDKNTTLLEGTTWYENRMWPGAYWKQGSLVQIPPRNQ